MAILRECLFCNKPFIVKPSTKGKFCSKVCYWGNMKGKEGNGFKTGHKNYITEEVRRIITQKLKGKKPKNLDYLINLPRTKEWCENIGKAKRGVELVKNQNENNHNWKGEKVGYCALHTWVKRKLGIAKKCEFCGEKKTSLPNSVGWANKGHTYKRNLTDWISLCIKCHSSYDKLYRRGLI
jgi:hypothetical protein